MFREIIFAIIEKVYTTVLRSKIAEDTGTSLRRSSRLETVPPFFNAFLSEKIPAKFKTLNFWNNKIRGATLHNTEFVKVWLKSVQWFRSSNGLERVWMPTLMYDDADPR